MKIFIKVITILFFFCLFGSINLCATPWGALINYVEGAESAPIGEKYLLRKVLKRKPLSISIQRNVYTDKEYSKFETLVQKSYSKWFSNVVTHIEKNKRKREFGDILALFRRGIDVQISEQGGDVLVVFLPFQEVIKKCHKYAYGCYRDSSTEGTRSPVIYLSLRDEKFWEGDQERVAMHEIGHSLGLSDQYIAARMVNSDPVYSSAEERKNVMQGYDNGLTCDDADGIINLMDITRGIRRGGEFGWKTLCKKSEEYYIGGIPSSKGQYRVSLKKNYEGVEVTIYEKGKKVSSNIYPYFMPENDVEWEETPAVKEKRKDGFGRPVLAEGPNGETIYYTYLYDRVERVAVKDGKVLNYVIRERNPSGNVVGKTSQGKDMKAQKMMVFGSAGTFRLLKLQTTNNLEYSTEYTEIQVGGDKISRVLMLHYTAAGDRLLEAVYNDPSDTEYQKECVPNDGGECISQAISNKASGSWAKQLTGKVDQWTRQALKELRNGKKDELK